MLIQYRSAIRLKPEAGNLALAHLQLGRAYVYMGRKEDALHVYRTLQTIDKAQAQELYAEINKPTAIATTSAEAYVAQGDEYCLAHVYAKATEAYKKAIALNPSLLAVFWKNENQKLARVRFGFRALTRTPVAFQEASLTFRDLSLPAVYCFSLFDPFCPSAVAHWRS
jgi:tetratricopeptide (TPR) repeat protein